MSIKRLSLLLFFVAAYHAGFSQIVDDSTKEIFGQHSTNFFLQEDVFRGFGEKRKLDTSINHLHYYEYKFNKRDNWYQGLGNLGMAMKPTYYTAPSEIGYRFGFEAFHPYLNTAKDQRYFDTKSPYSELQYIQGGSGEQRLFLLFTRNINRYWNLGASYNRFTSAKQLYVVQSRDFQTDHNQINVFSSVKSKKDKYIALARFNYMQHWSYESGGVKPRLNEGGVVDSGMYLYKVANVNLIKIARRATTSNMANRDAARNYYKTQTGRFYHQFNPLDSGITLINAFHEFDYTYEQQYFRDNNMKVDTSLTKFYKEAHFDDSISYYRYDYSQLQNKIGLKGNTKLFHYSLYYKHRNFSLLSLGQDSVPTKTIRFQDAFVGGDIAFKYTEDWKFNLSGETMLSFKVRDDDHPDKKYYKKHRDYQLKAEATFKKWHLEVGQSRVSPTLMQTKFVTNLATWGRSQDSSNAVINTNASLGYTHIKGDRLLSIGLVYQRVDNLVYFTRDTVSTSSDFQKIRPIQHKGYMDYLQPMVSFRTNWRSLFIENDLILTHVFTDKEVIHMPRWFTYPKIYFQNYLFKRATLVQAGAEVILKASYYADFYAPQINQFYWQNTFTVKTFPITNIFVNFKIRQVRVFLRYSNLFGQQDAQSGYMDTPYYPGMKGSFQFGLIWKAFD